MGSKGARRDARRRAAQKKRRKNRLTWAGVAVVGVLAVAVLFGALASGGSAAGATATDDWDLPALDGDGRIVLADFAGKPTVAAFFASWCDVCQRELPGFAALSHQLGDEVHFVGINTMNNGSGLGFAQQMGIGHWPLARDVGQHDGRQLATNFGARGSPTTVLYDGDGNVIDVTLGGMNAAQLADKLNQFFGVSP